MSQQLTGAQQRTIDLVVERVQVLFNPGTPDALNEWVLVELERSGLQTEAQYVREHPESIQRGNHQ